jgi:hypothetical protein
MLILFILLKREDGRIGGLRAHADKMQVLVLVLGSDSFAIRHPYIRIGPWRHRKFSGRKRVPGSFPFPPCATVTVNSGGMGVHVASTWWVCMASSMASMSACGGCVPNRRQGGGQRVSYSGSYQSHWPRQCQRRPMIDETSSMCQMHCVQSLSLIYNRGRYRGSVLITYKARVWGLVSDRSCRLVCCRR